MRVFSQKETENLSFESCAFVVCDEYGVVTIDGLTGTKAIVMAEYKTVERAKEVLKEMGEFYRHLKTLPFLSCRRNKDV